MSAPLTTTAEEVEPLESPAEESRRLRRGLISIALLIVLVGGLIFAVPGLREVEHRLREVDPLWILLAIALELGSCAGYVFAFQHVFERAPRDFAARVALSEMAFGAVVPAGGAGGIAVGAWIVRAKGGPLGRFVERSAVLFLLTSAVNVLTLGAAGLLVGLGVLEAPNNVLAGFIPAGVAAVTIAAFAALPRAVRSLSTGPEARRAVRWLGTTARVVRDTERELVRPRWRLLGAVAYLWCDIAMLGVCFAAVGDPMPVGALTLGFLIGYLGNVIPVPGGIGALDGGLAAALILYGASPASAAAAVLLYHALVLWIPTVLGTIAFVRVRRTLDEPLVLRS